MNQLPVADRSTDWPGRWWTQEEDGRILCQLCPRACRLKPDDRGFCFVRKRRGDAMILDTYGRSTGFCIDPIEKKPLNHFLPGTPVLSFGTAGCNLGCKFCQNWDISKSREVARLSDSAMPEDIAATAKRTGCRSVAFTYNDPVIWAEYAIDTAAACRAVDIKSVAVTAGYITDEARGEFFAAMDAANIDLKAFTEQFYYRLTGAHLDPVLRTIQYVANETDCWVELTNLVIPDANDNADELKRMCDWVLKTVGPDVPVHFTAFHPDFRMRDRSRTDPETLILAHEIAKQTGLHYPYVGNVHDTSRQSTVCPSCGSLLIERDWYQLGRYQLVGNRCSHCDAPIAGHFEQQVGNWGSRRQPIRISAANAGRSRNLSPDTNQLVTPTPQTKQTTVRQPPPPATTAPLDSFSQQEFQTLHQAACQLVAAAVRGEHADAVSILGTLADREISGVYVTLKRGQTLRGCCGLQGPPTPLAQALSDAAVRTAKHDPRMAPITAIELPHLELSVSLLGPPRPIGTQGDDRIGAVEIGKHGLRIRHRGNVGLLLPMVATERDWDARQFLDAVCRKANLPAGTWRSTDAELQIFDGTAYIASFQTEHEAVSVDQSVLSATDVTALGKWVGQNLIALAGGATPYYYATDVDDTTVAGVAITIQTPQGEAGWMHFSIREGVPMQSTLFRLTQQATQQLQEQLLTASGEIKVDIAVLSSVIHHGTDIDYELPEVDCNHRAILCLDDRRWSIAFDRQGAPPKLAQQSLRTQPFREAATNIYSAVCDTDRVSFQLSAGPVASSQMSNRPPAVAGVFYPAEDTKREPLVDRLQEDLEEIPRKHVAAAMVPHAGLRYSGRIAWDTWRRIELPETVLIIGPKHTAAGVDWAVAPHRAWQMSDRAMMEGDTAFAEQLAKHVPGMELDAAAHQQEHGIEVQLPLLYRLAPQTRIAAVAMHGGSLKSLRTAASALAELLNSMERPPLLVISSDMNHFADDVENRRRDSLALEKLRQNDPEGLLTTCREENISMCGQIPAALILMTLREQGIQPDYQQIGYTTSEDVSGDRSRVVGYAGVLF